MKYLKPYLFPVSGFIVLDQFLKIIIYCFFFDIQTEILGNMVRFRPVFNTNLSWGGNYIPILSEMVIVVFLNILIIVLFLSGYAFYRSKKPEFNACIDIIYVIGLAGSFCSLVDKIIWGGSLDYIQIVGLFTFDLKDCYLTIAQCLFVLIGIRYHNKISVKEYIKWCIKNK